LKFQIPKFINFIDRLQRKGFIWNCQYNGRIFTGLTKF